MFVEWEVVGVVLILAKLLLLLQRGIAVKEDIHNSDSDCNSDKVSHKNSIKSNIISNSALVVIVE